MTKPKRKRKIFSIKNELIEKSRESALCAVQIFNNPNIIFKTESFIVLMIISWTYLLHAYYRDNGVEYRHCQQGKKRRIFEKIKGRYKYWELEKCLNYKDCPLDKEIIANLKFLIELRHEIEHQMTMRIDELIGGKVQACCLNYNNTLKKLFDYDIAHHQPLSIQFFAFGEEQIDSLKNKPNVPKNIIDFIASYETELDEEERKSSKYSYRVIYLRDNANHVGSADLAVRYIPEGSEAGKEIQNILIKNKQYKKITQAQIIKETTKMGYAEFNTYEHQTFWLSKWKNAKDRNEKATKYGEAVFNNQWLWYEDTWLPQVLKYCEAKYPKKVS